MSNPTIAGDQTSPNFLQRLNRDYSPLVVGMVVVFILVLLFGAVTADNFLTWFNFKTIIEDLLNLTEDQYMSRLF